MFGFGSKRPIEEKMAEWLSHPNEFGVPPKVVKHKRTYKGKLSGYGNVEIHLIDYEMPNGTKGRGFVNGDLTWSFLGIVDDEVNSINSIKDEDLLVAYCGWAWLTAALHGGDVQTEFRSEGEEQRLLEKKQKEGLHDVILVDRFKIDTTEIFEYRASKAGIRVTGAGDSNTDVTFESGDPRARLPSIYFYIGGQVIESMR